jgi:arylsulfatase A-like enzyme
MAPHDPRTMPRQYLEMYDSDDVVLPPNAFVAHPFDNGELVVRDELLAARPRVSSEIRRHLAEYYAMISHLDAQIGRILAALEEAGHADDTIVMLAGDNGLALGQHGLMGKQNLYDHSIHVPLLMAGPGVPSGEMRETPCYLLDIYPTLCELAGLAVPASVQGKSLASALRDPSARPRQALFFAYRDYQRAVQTETHKLIAYAVDGVSRVQVFDRAADPWELHNLADLPSVADTRARLTTALLQARAEYKDHSPAFWGTYGV